MKEIRFPEWKEVLEASGLPRSQKRSFEITVRWFLSFCRRSRSGVTVQAARGTGEAGGDASAGLIEHTGASSPPSVREATDWEADFLTVVRRRNYSYRTEQSYRVWIERFARHLAGADLREQDGAAIGRFLDALALNERLSASSRAVSGRRSMRWCSCIGRSGARRRRRFTRT